MRSGARSFGCGDGDIGWRARRSRISTMLSQPALGDLMELEPVRMRIYRLGPPSPLVTGPRERPHTQRAHVAGRHRWTWRGRNCPEGSFFRAAVFECGMSATAPPRADGALIGPPQGHRCSKSPASPYSTRSTGRGVPWPLDYARKTIGPAFPRGSPRAPSQRIRDWPYRLARAIRLDAYATPRASRSRPPPRSRESQVEVPSAAASPQAPPPKDFR